MRCVINAYRAAAFAALIFRAYPVLEFCPAVAELTEKERSLRNAILIEAGF